MNRNFGGSAGVIALIAFVVHMAIPSGPEGGHDSSAPIAAANGKGGKPKPKPKDEGQSPDTPPEREGPWLATQAFFHSLATPNTQELPDFDSASDIQKCSLDKTCAEALRGYFGIGGPKHIQFLLATVPDPLHTRLSLFTDTSIEAIQKAATDEDWQFATQWLPWSDEVDPDEGDPIVRTAQREFIRKRERQPGILVFRPKSLKSDAVLVVFLIGETPTEGVNPTEFQIARAYMRSVQDPEEPVRIQGPTFSGSLYSLKTLLEEDTKLKQSSYVVRSGTVTDDKTKEEFDKGSNFSSAASSSSTYFPEVLGRLGIEPQDAAILVEDETAYGYAVARDSRDYTVFRFPRDISHLRNAYREAAPQGRPNGPPASDLDFSLKDSDVAEDSIPTFSKAQTALSQNGVINEITGAIQRKRIRIIRIDATNVLDLLFLARVLRQQCPDTRLMVPYSDLLFVQAAHTDALTGTLALSPYPLFVDGNDFGPSTFPGSNAEGVYEASVLLLRGGSASAPPDPFVDPRQWLLTLDREGFVPVQFWSAGNDVKLKPQKVLPARWIVISDLAALLAVALCVWMVCLWRKKTIFANAAFTLDVVDSEPDARRLFYLFLVAFILTAIQVTLCTPFWLNRPAPVNFSTDALLCVGILCSWACAAFALWYTKPWYKIPGGFVFAIFCGSLYLWFQSCRTDNGGSGFFFSFRAIELRVGSSPMWPVIASLTVLLLFSVVHLTRLYLAVYEKPEVKVEEMGTILQPRLKYFYDRINTCAESAVGIWTTRQITGAAAVVMALAIPFFLARMYLHLGSIDPGKYDELSICLVVASTATILLVCWHAATMWHSLQGLLKCLQMLPLARAFIPQDASGNSRPLWVRRLNLQSIDTLADALIVLHDMSRLDSSWHFLFDCYRAQVRKFVEEDSKRERLTAHGIRLTTRAFSMAISVEAFRVAQEGWASSALVEKYAPHTTDEEDGQCRRRHAPLEIDAEPDLGRLAETFVALHYSSFLLYGVSQVRNLLLFLSSGFVLLVISVNSYSPQSPRLIGRLLLALFVLVGAVIWKCLTGMERDPILSRIAGTAPGKLTLESYVKIFGYGALPVLGLLASQFPSISSFLYSWIAPSLQSAH
jgi:hypothetical protein